MGNKTKSFYLSYPEIKEKKQDRPYGEDRCCPRNENFWDPQQKEMYDRIYSTLKVFEHKYVNWSDISDLGNVVSTKYENLGLKDLTSYSENWEWREDIIKQFYGTLFINSSCTKLDFMIGSKLHREVKKEVLEKALGINPGDKDITTLHSLPEWKEDNADACSLYVVPTTNTKEVRDLKPEVDLIQKINRMTLLPRTGSKGACSDMLLKLAHAIYHERHFDVAHFLLSEMRIAIETPDHGLPYGHYIFCLLRHMKIIPAEIDGKKCSKYSPKVMEESVVLKSIAARIGEFSEKIDKSKKKYVKRFEIIESGLENFEKLKEEEVQRHSRLEEKHSEKRFYCQVYKRRSRTDDS